MNTKRGTGTGTGIDQDQDNQDQWGFRACDTYLGNAAFVTGSCGFLVASTVVAALAAGAGSGEDARPPVVPIGPPR
jgi:tRNA A37 threonylcarbamoyladenosine dehydratase